MSPIPPVMCFHEKKGRTPAVLRDTAEGSSHRTFRFVSRPNKIQVKRSICVSDNPHAVQSKKPAALKAPFGKNGTLFITRAEHNKKIHRVQRHQTRVEKSSIRTAQQPRKLLEQPPSRWQNILNRTGNWLEGRLQWVPRGRDWTQVLVRKREPIVGASWKLEDPLATHQ